MATNTCNSPRFPSKPSCTKANRGPDNVPLDSPFPGSPFMDLSLDRHRIQCPRCRKNTVRFWPGRLILFASMQCAHCGGEFLIVQNEALL
jgi:hypothetical protein